MKRFQHYFNVLGGSREIYAMAMNTTPDKVDEQWNKALINPIPPVIVESGPVHDEVKYVKDFNRESGGLYELPIPISTPGFDCAPYLTSPYWVTKDPETGITNIGTYRGMIKAADRTGIMTHQAQHIGIHLQKAKATRPFAFPAVSLPRKEYMENAKNIWEELGLPTLTPKAPWHGYTLGYWSKENEEEARLAVEGKHNITGTKLAAGRVQMKDL